jgi:hypothetical protein
MQGMNDLLKTQLLLSMSTVGNPMMSFVAVNVLDIANRTFPTWSAWTKAACCSRRPKKAAAKAEAKVAPTESKESAKADE